MDINERHADIINRIETQIKPAINAAQGAMEIAADMMELLKKEDPERYKKVIDIMRKANDATGKRDLSKLMALQKELQELINGSGPDSQQS